MWRRWVWQAGGLALLLTLQPGLALAQVQQTGDDYMVEARAEAVDGAGHVILTATCRSLLGQEVAGSQAGRVSGALADGTPVAVGVTVAGCSRVLAQPTYWGVDDEMDASVSLGDGDSAVRITWKHKGSQTILVGGRTEVGSATLTLADGAVLALRVTLGAIRLPEPNS
jgi:hypothetical protein